MLDILTPIKQLCSSPTQSARALAGRSLTPRLAYSTSLREEIQRYRQSLELLMQSNKAAAARTTRFATCADHLAPLAEAATRNLGMLSISAASDSLTTVGNLLDSSMPQSHSESAATVTAHADSLDGSQSLCTPPPSPDKSAPATLSLVARATSFFISPPKPRKKSRRSARIPAHLLRPEVLPDNTSRPHRISPVRSCGLTVSTSLVSTSLGPGASIQLGTLLLVTGAHAASGTAVVAHAKSPRVSNAVSPRLASTTLAHGRVAPALDERPYASRRSTFWRTAQETLAEVREASKRAVISVEASKRAVQQDRIDLRLALFARRHE